ncbi:hypothetical protein LV779_03060 [Streptomyces thinghirensis]|nr:hypothetical protein [Streptomyces thinghirensis]
MFRLEALRPFARRATRRELNPVELLWSAIKARELAHLAGDHLADVADAAERGIHRVCSSEQLCRRRRRERIAQPAAATRNPTRMLSRRVARPRIPPS